MDIETENNEEVFVDVFHELSHPTKNKRDPKTVRLAAVSAAIREVIQGDMTASKVYVKTLTTLEGAWNYIKTEKMSSDVAQDALMTKVALLQLVSATVPYIESPSLVGATLSRASQTIRGVVADAIRLGDEAVLEETKDDLGSVSSVLRAACRASVQIMKIIPSSTDEKNIKQFLIPCLVSLFRDRRTKVRKAAQDGVVELLLQSDFDSLCHPVIIKTMTTFIHTELKKVKKNPTNQALFDLVQVLPFVERSILHLDYSLLCKSIMELLTVLMHDQSSATAEDYVAVAKIREATPKVQVIAVLLSSVDTMLADESESRKAFLDEFSARVAASLLQSKPNVAFRQGSAESTVLVQAQTQFGQTLLAATRRTLVSNLSIGVRLLPVCVQMTVALCRPDEDDPNDSSVGNVLLVDLTSVFRETLPLLVDDESAHNCVAKSVERLEQILLPIYKSTWPLGLKCLAIVLKHAHQILSIRTNVAELVRIRSEMEVGSDLQYVAEDALSTLVQGIGLEECWEMLDFQPDESMPGRSFSDRPSLLCLTS